MLHLYRNAVLNFVFGSRLSTFIRSTLTWWKSKTAFIRSAFQSFQIFVSITVTAMLFEKVSFFDQTQAFWSTFLFTSSCSNLVEEKLLTMRASYTDQSWSSQHLPNCSSSLHCTDFRQNADIPYSDGSFTNTQITT